ncbi:hypothetical protein [Streptomyces sp. NPDC059134]|uniref:hypothetical protein n=1 Tax=Streptomyces sp. NPDC059134 TaxID=3346738 RepID=UPI00367DC836
MSPDAERPGLVAGGPVDAHGSRGDLIALAGRLNAQAWSAPVWNRGTLREDHALCGGVLPPILELLDERLAAQHDVVMERGARPCHFDDLAGHSESRWAPS